MSLELEYKDLINTAENEAIKALKPDFANQYTLKLKGSLKEWDDSVNQNVMEVLFKVFKTSVIVNVELDAVTGELLSIKEIK